MHDLSRRELFVAMVVSAVLGLGGGSVAWWGTGTAEVSFFGSLAGLCLVLAAALAVFALAQPPRQGVYKPT